MNRWKAFGSHIALSALVIGGIATTAFLLWYPYSLHRVAGLDRVLLVMLAIDLTAGPLLTLVIYRKGKPGLHFDLFVIALCQIAFLGYGLHTLWQGRPVFLVGTPDTFTLVFANEIDQSDLRNAPDARWRRLSWTGPVLVGTRMPESPDARRKVIEEFMAGGAGIERTPRYYLPYRDIAPALLHSARSTYSAEDAQADNGPGALMAAPIVSRRGEGWMLVDREGMPVRVVEKDQRP